MAKRPVTGGTGIHHFCGLLSQNAYARSNDEKTSHTPKLRDAVYNKCPVLFKNVKAIERRRKTEKLS